MSWVEIWNRNPRCNEFVSWWGGEYEGNCERDPDHEGDHYDGLSWYDDEGQQAEPDSSYDVETGPNAIWRRCVRGMELK